VHEAARRYEADRAHELITHGQGHDQEGRRLRERVEMHGRRVLRVLEQHGRTLEQRRDQGGRGLEVVPSDLLLLFRSGAGPGHRGQHLGPRRLEVEDDAIGAAGRHELGGDRLQQRFRLVARRGHARDASYGGGARSRLALLAQQRARLQEEGGVVGEGPDDPLVARTRHVIGVEDHDDRAPRLVAGEEGRGQGAAGHAAEAEARQPGGGVGDHGRLAPEERPAQVPGLVHRHLAFRVAPPRGGHAQHPALQDDRHRRLVTDDAPHLIEDRAHRGLLAERPHEGP
jgi:hypothetical protein